MKQLLNTLYVMTQGAYLSLDHETVRVEVNGALQLQVPLHHLVLPRFARTTVSGCRNRCLSAKWTR